jgi:hypothetical protein
MWCHAINQLTYSFSDRIVPKFVLRKSNETLEKLEPVAIQCKLLMHFEPPLFHVGP